MPIDYSKFDHIDDSGDEAPGRTQPQPSSKGRDGRELLEAGGLEEKLTLLSGAVPRMTVIQHGRREGQHAKHGEEEGKAQGKGPGKASPGGYPGDTPEMAALAAELEKIAGKGYGKTSPEEPPKAGEPQRVSMRSDGRKKIHTTYPDGGEMVEEFDEKTDVLLVRKVRKPSKLGKEGEWVYEVGQATETAFDPYSDLLKASSSNPIFLRKDTPEHLQWRIRNLSYPADVYSVTVDHEKQEIVVRTSNKKYFKRIQVPDLARFALKLQEQLLSWKHQHSTLIISYRKPPEIVAGEQQALREAERSAVKM
ncbi:unnamed protein product [Effrenium voratum]|nr:unnamed protein product [Effrenium voratum]